MSPTCLHMLSQCRQCRLNMSRRHHVANVVTGFGVESRVGLDIYLAFFYLDIYMVIFSRLHNSKDVSVARTTGTGHSHWWGIVCTSQGYPRDVHHFGCHTVLLSVRTVYGFGRLLHRPGISIGQTHHMFCSCLRKRSFKFLVWILISFMLNIRK